ncbi:hypothetical protein QJS10_CPA01g02336 [Acorus calamus]|uniref:Glycine-rich protein n=1 Tax=Acorus calamus TaxID=4465 RepID=A0AAV9FGL3_ACOCL|nr:hypothetical protein QJS10_CPA01g02336 [Acorus calamus]
MATAAAISGAAARDIKNLDDFWWGPPLPPGYGGGGGGGYGGPGGGGGYGFVNRGGFTCTNKGKCYNKKLVCPKKCFTSYSYHGKNGGGGGGGGGCSYDCKSCTTRCSK